MSILEPKILKGTRDFGPEEAAKRLSVIDKIRSVFIKNGYDAIETPAIEYAETILGKYGEEGDKLTYAFQDHGGRHIALRYDLTVPTARFVAANWTSLPMPFKRYQIGPVWRADKPQRGRFREFYQCDIDIIGSTSAMADAEIAKVIYDVFTALGFDKFLIRINSRRLMNDILEKCKVKKTDRVEVIRAIDKLDKTSLKEVEKDLEKTCLDKKQVKELSKIALSEKARHNLSDVPAGSSKNEIESVMKAIRQFGVPDKNIALDLTLARGLDYYTGVVYEVIIPESGLGSVCGGGRYDDLTELFSDRKFPGTGVAFGFDRIMTWLDENKKLKDVKLSSQVLVVNFPDVIKDNLKTLDELHKAGIAAEIYLEDAKLPKQLKYADKKQITWVIVQGSDEVKKKKVTLKNMKTGKQELLSLKEVLQKIQ